MQTIDEVTYLFSRFLCVLGLLVFPIVGCSDVGSGGGTGGSAAAGGGTSGTGGMAGSGGTPGPEVLSLLVEVVEFDPDEVNGLGPPFEGARVCQVDADNCVLSNPDGRATLNLPANQDVAWTVEKDGYGPFVFGDATDETFGGPVGSGNALVAMFTHEQLAAIAAQLGTAYPWTGGIVGLNRGGGPHPGMTFTPVGSTVAAVGEGFYFDAAMEQYSLDLEATTAFPRPWNIPLAAGGFTEVTPGEQQFELGGTAGDCVPNFGWHGDGPNRIRLPVLEGHITWGSMLCE